MTDRITHQDTSPRRASNPGAVIGYLLAAFSGALCVFLCMLPWVVAR